ncbi:CCA tRNA nucleotidyltransferase [Aerococcus kribbianus]|uniref:CCA-adding enzyme n=1 Tax=Aerococcus kribbianus TaxID=2999064 RepID=A0A9X3JDM4_9LACT|nr:MULTISPECIES: CCA tRNA nucleotidyltransferase [unclassified Aerococcus]MCZ0717650.1 CCA tRNA nucleotidyltransferase [Aerococcus sp. YH-aer221]MCZ0725938.1 CCA tRNA nucleotidyltransferase [Aerococcus sp. YH-aer222]
MLIDNPKFQAALPIVERLEAAGFDAYFVGGCVRDGILGRPINDIDIASSAYPEEVQRLFPKHFDVGLEHGTVMVWFQQDTYEITTFRTEAEYQDFRRPDSVTFVQDLSEDLLRRDFTMNALALNSKGQIVDYFSGQQAIAKKEIVAVGNPYDRFHEDALRMMRAVRFSGQLGFTIASETWQGICDNAQLLEKIAIERILVEMNKLWESPYWHQGITAYTQTGLYAYCPGLQNWESPLSQLLADLSSDMAFTESSLAWAVLLWTAGCLADDDHKKLARAWKISNADRDRISAYVALLIYRSDHATYDSWFLYQQDIDQVLKLERFIHGQADQDSHFATYFHILDLDQVKKSYQNLPIHQLKDLAINGRDIIHHFAPDNKAWIGKALKLAEKAVVLGQVSNEPTALFAYLTDY